MPHTGEVAQGEIGGGSGRTAAELGVDGVLTLTVRNFKVFRWKWHVVGDTRLAKSIVMTAR